MWKWALGVVVLVAGIVPALGQSEPNLASKSVRVVIGSAPGGTYDLLGRAVARHIGRHLPGNPAVVPQNMPGAGGLVAANLHLQCRAQGRHRDRDLEQRRRRRRDRRRAGGPLRRDPDHLARHAVHGDERLLRLQFAAA